MSGMLDARALSLSIDCGPLAAADFRLHFSSSFSSVKRGGQADFNLP